ncbi:MAG: LPS export ABC transporter periplasmic protein LptC, partial [Bdellovibrionales bacterium]|nr:LPS export ABC transporter periplasmic protein LptC [Bdellovibrionales bacterium]
ELEGNVAVQLDDSIRMRTDLAIYDSNSREITAPGAVTIEGKGFEVRGRGLDMAIDNQIVKLSDDVYSYFESRAEIPSGVGFAKSS